MSDRPLAEDLAGALNFILAFYEPGQTYLDTVAWERAAAGGAAALNRAVDEGVWVGGKLQANKGAVRRCA